MIAIFQGETIAEINPNPKGGAANSNILIHDSARNKLILSDVKNELAAGQRVTIITERKSHIETLYQFLKQSHETITLSGDDSTSSRDLKWKKVREGNYQVLITTGQLFGEGTDLQNCNRLFLVYPFSFKGKLIQYIGRVQRSEVIPIIYDYHDYKIDYLHKMFLKRNTWYRKIEHHADLFDDEFNDSAQKKTVVYNARVRVQLKDTEFRFGAIAINHTISDRNINLEFEVENDLLRPEFVVLLPFIAKLWKHSWFTADLHAEFAGEQLIAQQAISEDIARIDETLINQVKNSWLKKQFVTPWSQGKFKSNFITFSELFKSDEISPDLLADENELIDKLVSGNEYIHSRELRYLAEKHQKGISAIRYLLTPFSLTFILKGNQQFYLVLETIDTEEATYIWDLGSDSSTENIRIGAIEEQLDNIRKFGRQTFLQSAPLNFTRIIHDYSDPRKGFVLWKSQIESLMR